MEFINIAIGLLGVAFVCVIAQTKFRYLYMMTCIICALLITACLWIYFNLQLPLAGYERWALGMFGIIIMPVFITFLIGWLVSDVLIFKETKFNPSKTQKVFFLIWIVLIIINRIIRFYY